MTEPLARADIPTFTGETIRAYGRMHGLGLGGRPASRYAEMAAAVVGLGQLHRVLDVGSSVFMLFLQDVVAPDAQVECAQPAAPPALMTSRVSWVEADLTSERLPWEDGHFDLVVLGEVLEHLTVHPAAPLAEVCRILRPGGHLLLTTPNVASLERARLACGRSAKPPLYAAPQRLLSHFCEYTMGECLRLLCDAGLTVESVRFSLCANRLGVRREQLRRTYRSSLKRGALLPLLALYCLVVWLVPQWRTNMQILAVRRVSRVKRPTPRRGLQGPLNRSDVGC